MKIEKRAVWLIFLSAFLLRLLFVILVPLDAGDTPEYDDYALNLLGGFGFSANIKRPPLYPLFLTVIYFFFGHNFLAVRIVQAVLDAAACVLVYFLGKKIFQNKKTAFLGASLAVINPSLIASTSYILTETLTTLLLTSTVFFSVRAWKEKKKSDWVRSGILSGLATLTRPVTLLFPPFLLIGLYCISRKVKENLVFVVLFSLGMLVPILPWTVRNVLVFRQFIPVATGGGFNLWVGSYPPWNGDYNWQDFSDANNLVKGLSSVEADKKFFAEGIKNIKQNPGAYAFLCFRKMGRFWLQIPGGRRVLEGRQIEKVVLFILQYLLLFLAVLGIRAAFQEKNRLVFIPILMITYFTLTHIFLLAIPRYHIPVLPLLAVIAGKGIRRLPCL
ncbi:MAG: glycosyltransferase family 39 protein [Candidatus Omnitrophota bacterium]